MLGVVAVTLCLAMVIITVAVADQEIEKAGHEGYIQGYNDSLLDIDEILEDLSDRGVYELKTENIRNRIAQEYMEVED